jgi:hypothetical protein
MQIMRLTIELNPERTDEVLALCAANDLRVTGQDLVEDGQIIESRGGIEPTASFKAGKDL